MTGGAMRGPRSGGQSQMTKAEAIEQVKLGVGPERRAELLAAYRVLRATDDADAACWVGYLGGELRSSGIPGDRGS